MPEVDYVVLTEWFDWIQNNTDVSVDLIGKFLMGSGGPCLLGGFPYLEKKTVLVSWVINNHIIQYNGGCNV